MELWLDSMSGKFLIPRNTALCAFAVGSESYTAHQMLVQGTGMEPRIGEAVQCLRAEAMGVFGSWPL